MVICKICGWQGENFKDLDCGYGRVYTPALCPNCKSQPRHRSIYAYITENEVIPRKISLKLLLPFQRLSQDVPELRFVVIPSDRLNKLIKETVDCSSFFKPL